MAAVCVVASPIRVRSPTNVPGPNARRSTMSEEIFEATGTPAMVHKAAHGAHMHCLLPGTTSLAGT